MFKYSFHIAFSNALAGLKGSGDVRNTFEAQSCNIFNGKMATLFMHFGKRISGSSGSAAGGAGAATGAGGGTGGGGVVLALQVLI